MAQLISEIWEGLRDAGLPEVMLFLPDQSASRCHWKDTAMIGTVRVALLADQDRQIVRIVPVDSCAGIGIASPKGIDPSGYKREVYKKLKKRFGGEAGDPSDEDTEEAEADMTGQTPGLEAHGAVATPVYIQPAPPEPEPEPAPKPDPLASRWGATPRTSDRRAAGQPTSFGATRRT
jgi:hypothetical protein